VVTALATEHATVPVVPAICFVREEWAPFARPHRFGSVVVLRPGTLTKLICASGPLSAQTIDEIAGRPVHALPAA
jgi:hypothetical protein